MHYPDLYIYASILFSLSYKLVSGGDLTAARAQHLCRG